MAPWPRLLATDLDGTIVRSDGTISARTIAAFARVEDAGADYVLVTGRPPRLMGGIAAAFGKLGTAICSNGALIYDMHAGAVVGENVIAPAAAAEAARRLRAAAPGIGIAIEYADELAADDRYEPDDWDAGARLHRLADAELFARPAPKLLGRHPRLSADELLAVAAPALAGVVTAYHANGQRLVEAVGIGVSKAAALARLAAQRDIRPADVVAFGDMPNDLPMLAWAGVSYAVANAHPAVLAAVGQVIGGHDEDGVAVVVERLFPARV